MGDRSEREPAAGQAEAPPATVASDAAEPSGGHRLRLRHLTLADYDDVASIMNHHYPEQGA
jgi:hypothetical protein